MRMTENCMRMTDRIPVVHDQHAHVLSSNSTDISDALCNSICRTWVCAEEFLRVDALEMGILAFVTEFA